MTYFYLAVAALFVGYHTLARAGNSIANVIPYLSYVVAMVFYWSAKGYYYWNIHWIRLVHHYEKHHFKWRADESVYHVFYNKNLNNKYWSPTAGANFSTSKLTVFFSFLIAFGWGYFIAYSLLDKCRTLPEPQLMVLAFLMTSGFTVSLSVCMKKGPFNSYLDKTPDLINDDIH